MSATATFLVLYSTPADPETFERHYSDVHVPLTKALPGLRSYTLARQPRTIRGDACYLIATLEWDTMTELQAAFASPEGRAATDDMATITQLVEVRSMIYQATPPA